MQKTIALYGILLAFFTGCANMSTLQTARTLPEKTFRVSAGAGLFSFPELKNSGASGGTVTHSSTLPYLEIGGRMGIQQGLEVGGKLTFPSTLAIDAKYQLTESEKFASAIGLGASYIAIAASPNSSSGVDAEALDAILPLYLSYDFTPGVGIYSSPKFVFRYVTGPESKTYELAGMSVGARFGDEMGFFVEGTWMKYLNTTTNDAYQFNAAFFFGNAPSVPKIGGTEQN